MLRGLQSGNRNTNWRYNVEKTKRDKIGKTNYGIYNIKIIVIKGLSTFTQENSIKYNYNFIKIWTMRTILI